MGTNGHIPALYDAAKVRRKDGTTSLILVMEYYPTDLSKYLDGCAFSDLKEKQIIRLLYSLLCCISFIHSADVMHRDIKPSNLLLSSDLRVTIGDFGFSRTSRKEQKEGVR